MIFFTPKKKISTTRRWSRLMLSSLSSVCLPDFSQFIFIYLFDENALFFESRSLFKIFELYHLASCICRVVLSAILMATLALFSLRPMFSTLVEDSLDSSRQDKLLHFPFRFFFLLTEYVYSSFLERLAKYLLLCFLFCLNDSTRCLRWRPSGEDSV